jgi:hypothetical protein
MAFHTYGGNEELDSKISAFNRYEKLFRISREGQPDEEVWEFEDEVKQKYPDAHIVKLFQGSEYPIQ